MCVIESQRVQATASRLYIQGTMVMNSRTLAAPGNQCVVTRRPGRHGCCRVCFHKEALSFFFHPGVGNYSDWMSPSRSRLFLLALLAYIASMAASVFLSHAGEHKRGFVAYLGEALCDDNIGVFLDEKSLKPGDQAWERTIYNLKAAPVGARLATNCLKRPSLADTQCWLCFYGGAFYPYNALGTGVA